MYLVKGHMGVTDGTQVKVFPVRCDLRQVIHILLQESELSNGLVRASIHQFTPWKDT